MLRALVELGKYKHSSADTVEADKVLVVELDKDLNYVGLRIEVFDEEKVEKYFHVKKGNVKNSPGFTPTFVKPKDKILKKPDTVARWLNDGIGNIFSKEVQIDASEIRQKVELENSKSFLITVEVNGKYLGEIDEVKERVKKLKGAWYIEERQSGEGTCSSCGQDGSVIGDYFPLAIYTVDNPAYAPGLSKDLAYTHMPICPECLELARRGVDLMRSNLTFTTAGLRYYFLPELVVSPEGFNFQDILKVLESEKLQNAKIDPEVIATRIKEKTGLENLDWFRVHIIFAEEKQSSIRLNAVIEDVFPSRLGYVYKIREQMNEYMNGFSMEDVRNLTPDPPSFFKLLRIAYLGEEMKKENLISMLLEGLRRRLKTSDNKDRSLGNYGYLMLKVYLFIKTALEGKEMQKVELTEENLEEFLSQYFEGNETLVGVAIVGKLVRHIERVQYAKGYNPNFFWKLSELNLNWDGLENLMTELLTKANKYELGENFMKWYSCAVQKIGRDKREGISRESINFALCVGYALDYVLAKQKQGGKEHE